jgi:hypothetical protein
MADPVHSLHPERILAVDLGEPDDRHEAEEVDDGSNTSANGDKPGPKLSPARRASATTEPVRAAT